VTQSSYAQTLEMAAQQNQPQSLRSTVHVPLAAGLMVSAHHRVATSRLRKTGAFSRSVTVVILVIETVQRLSLIWLFAVFQHRRTPFGTDALLANRTQTMHSHIVGKRAMSR
jgi:hypothetical protein